MILTLFILGTYLIFRHPNSMSLCGLVVSMLDFHTRGLGFEPHERKIFCPFLFMCVAIFEFLNGVAYIKDRPNQTDSTIFLIYLILSGITYYQIKDIKNVF